MLPLLVLFAGAAAAQETTGVYSGDLTRLDDADLDARIALLDERLEAGKLHGQLWQYGFMGVYGIGFLYGTLEATTDSDNRAQVSGSVTAVKSLLGTARILWSPDPSRLGAEPMRAIPGDSREARMARLAAGERQLQKLVKRAESRFDWRRHTFNVGINAAGGVVTGLLASTQDAAIDATLGFVVGTINALTIPWRAPDDLRDYRQSFGTPADPPVSLHLTPLGVPGAHGLALRVEF